MIIVSSEKLVYRSAQPFWQCSRVHDSELPYHSAHSLHRQPTDSVVVRQCCDSKYNDKLNSTWLTARGVIWSRGRASRRLIIRR